VEDGSAGLPLGVQVVARHWDDHVVLSVMGALDEHFQGAADYPTQADLVV
jgi:fatty acid amide hydrolase